MRSPNIGLGAAAVISALCLVVSPCRGLDPARAITQYAHDAWRTEQGLPQNSVQAIAQTRDGYLWLGTQEGLVRFDGVRFTVFDEKNAPSLGNAHVLTLRAASDGSLWIGTRGRGILRWREGRFTSFKDPNPAANVVRALFEDSRGRLWAGTDGGLLRFEKDRFVPAYPADAKSPDVVMAIAESKGEIWFGTDGGGLRRLKERGLDAFTKKEGLSSDAIRALWADLDGTLWIGTRGGGLNRLREGRAEALPTQGGAWSTIGSSAMQRDRAGNLWIGTRGGGLLRLQGERISSFSKGDGLSSDIVLSLYEDREGSLWVGTDGEGLHRFKDGKVTPFSTQEGLSNNLLLPIYEDRNGTVWLGSYGGGLNAFRDGVFRAYTTRQGLSSDMVVSLAGDPEGNLWIGTDGGGLNRLSGDRVTRFGSAEGLSSNRVTALLSGREGGLWVGTYGGGLDLLRGGRFTVYGPAEGLGSPMILALTEDRNGTLWVGTDGGGLFRFRDGRFTALTARDGLANDTVYRIYEDADGVLWIGTFEGLSRLKDGKFATYTTKTGLFDSRIFQILEDDDGRLWMSCNKGIFRVSRKELNDVAEGRARVFTPAVFGRADGMKSSECNGTSQPAGWKAHDGTLWFPTTLGAVRIDPRHLPSNSQAPPVAIESVAIDKRTYDLVGRLTAPPGGGELEIRYTGLSFLDPSRVRFRYRLDGFDRSWVESDTRRVAYYTNTPPGRYVFRVIACNNDGVWNEQGGSLEIVLEPHFYQTLWFYGLCALGAVLAGTGVHRFRVRALTRRTNELSRMVAERTAQLEEANAILRQLSAQDGLTGIANRRHFDEELDREWRRAIRAKSPLSLVMLDIDSFKPYNDQYGHQQGDECLKRVASTLKELLKRPGDVCARYGGEEFAVILPATTLEGGTRVAETLRAGIEALGIAHARSQGSGVITVSVGVSSATPADEAGAPSLITRADEALYRAKQTGRNRVCVADRAV